ncbi:hypothetical protein COU54_04385 [Candidatus Pacearchaeota archaeon CG10_big_fil_rev_8_21_14_0_10_31_24]|nr:MAG: hypothetical protein COU54_04385 [Candidatus Pacearchaeota archaeon CG10_big_fil_rev_8_21_14_0_10_31_24]
MKTLYILTLISLALILFSSHASAIVITNVQVSDIFPGQESDLRISFENNLNENIEEVSMLLNLQGLPISSIGSSEDNIGDIDEGDDGLFVFKLRAASTAEPRDYQVPYTITYLREVNDALKPESKSGTLGVRITGNVILTSSIRPEKPVLNQEDTLIIKIINTGFAGARFVTVNLVTQGLILNSDPLVHIGDIRADDFETVSFNVIYTSESPKIEAIIKYKDFDNNDKTLVSSETLTIYNQEQAIKRGIIAKNNTPQIIITIVILIILWLIWRAIKKRRRLKRSMQNRR